MKIESDRATVWGGIRHGRTLGSPVALLIENRDHANWAERMNPWPVEEDDRGGPPAAARATPTSPACSSTATPTCATCWSARARARPPRGWRPAALAKAFLRALGITVHSHVVQIGSVTAPGARDRRAGRTSTRVDESPVRCLDEEASAAMVAEIDRARKANESLGGVFEVRAFGVLPGPRLAHRLGRAHRRAARVRADVDPRDEGRRDRRRVRPRRPRRLAGPRRDLLGRGARLRRARPTAPAASRAA